METNIASFLKLSMGKDSALPAEVLKTLSELGWRPVHGSYDFVYRWKAYTGKGGKKMPELPKELKMKVDNLLRAYDIAYVLRSFVSPEKK